MLEAARRARTPLREAAPRVAAFLRGELNDDGGGKNRAGRSDIYYTVFVLEGLLALGVDPAYGAVRRYLANFADGGGLDLVKTACLVRCWAAMPEGAPAAGRAEKLLQQIESHRTPDGGYNSLPGSPHGTAYHALLALGAYQDLGRTPPGAEGLLGCLQGLRAGDGAYANSAGLAFGTTPATAAATTLMQELRVPVEREVVSWLIARCRSQGGFLATPASPLPDLLSTATALHALAGLGVELGPIREPCLDFLDSLWTGGGFCGHWADDMADSEYTFYALLALGHLST
ncbi:MAG: prenyltransferase/squalene oxidase repeat-containing protein [Planctomycetota bacterium]